MSKVSLTSYMGDNSLKTSNHTTSKTLLAKSPREVKLNNARSPYKPGSNLIRNVSNSPFETIQKPSYALTNIKSPTEKSYLVGSLGDNVDAKENCSFEAKLLPSTQRDVKKTIISFNTNKSIADIIPANMVKSGTTSQLITQRNKSPTCENYEALTSRTSRKPEIQIQKAFVPLMKESKSSSLLEPSKKASLPTSLKLTLEKICRKEGSSTHRIVLGSPTSEASKLGEIVSGQQKKVARAKNEEVDRSTSDVNAKHKLKMLVGLTKAPISQRKKSSKNVNSVNGTPRQDYSAVYSIDEDSEMMKRYNKLVGLLKEKNQEIKKLSENNSHLQNTLDFMEEELKGLRKEKGGPGCKNEIPGDICDSIQLDDSRAQSYRQTGRSPALSPTMMQSVYLYQKSAIDLSSSEIKPSKPMASPLGVAYQKNVKSISDRMGKSWIINMDDRTRDSRKRSSHADSSLDHTEGVEKNSWYAKPEQIVQGHKEKLSYLKEIDEEFEEQRNRNVKMSELPENLTRNADNQRKKIRKLKLEKRERETASFRDEVILRNSSVDAEGGQSGQVSRRNGGLNNTVAPFTPGLTNREELGNFDIGEALNGLKDRIKNLLVKKDGGSAKNDALYQNLRAHFQKGN